MIGDTATLLDVVPAGSAVVADQQAYPVDVPELVTHQANTFPQVAARAEFGDWSPATADQSYIVPAVGGEPGKTPALGYTTGLSVRRMFTSPITGRVLIPPRTTVNPAVGPVGLSSHSTSLIAGVQSQTAAPPTVQQIAQSFIKPDVTAIIANGGY